MSMSEILVRLTHAFEGTIDVVLFNTVLFYQEYKEFFSKVALYRTPPKKRVVKKTFALAFDIN